MSCNRSIGAISALLVTALVPLASGASPYAITDLGTLSSGASYGYSVNNSGQVTGWSYVPPKFGGSGHHAFLYSAGTMRDLGFASDVGQDYESDGYGINASGQVCGTGVWFPSTRMPRAFIYDAGQYTGLSSLYGDTHYSEGYAINDSGQVVGTADGPRGYHAVRYSGGAWKDLGTIGGYDGSAWAYGINNAGKVTGACEAAAGTRAFLYNGSFMQDLGTLGGGYSVGYGINDINQVAGTSKLANGADRAFLYSNGTMQNLGALGGCNTYGRGINASGQVVGYAGGSSLSPARAFLYTDGLMYDLNNLLLTGSGWTLQAAYDISDNGYITGYGTNRFGQTRAFLLTPVPEPATLALAGLATLALLPRRKSH